MTLNKEELLEFKTTNDGKFLYTRINDFMDYVYQNDLYEYTDDIYDDKRIKYMLQNVENIKCDYLIKDNYGNFNNITNNDINTIIDNIVYDLDKKLGDSYEI